MKTIHFLHKKVEKLNPLKVMKILKKKGIFLFSPIDFQRIFDVSQYAAKNFINRHLASGFFIKLRNNMYTITDSVPPKFVIANKLYIPSYISFETALTHYHIIPEIIYTVYSATPKTSREFEALDSTFVYHRMKRALYFGYTAIQIDGMSVHIAEPEKAVADYLYFIALRKKTINKRMDIRNLNKKKLSQLARACRNIKVEVLLGKVYDQQTTH